MARLVVVGGGIGGLSAALALADRGGHEVVVLERAPRFAEIGAGIQIAPNGLAALDELGVGQAARSLGVRVAELRMIDAPTDTALASVPLDDRYLARFGRPYLVVHRAELHRCLYRACTSRPRITLRTDAAVTGVAQDPERATVRLASGQTVHADAVIGADGVRSVVREQLLGRAPLVRHGITVYRAAVPMEEVDADLRTSAVTWWVGPGCHLVSYPIAGGSLMNLAASHADGRLDTERSGEPTADGRVLQLLAGLGGSRARRLLSHATGWRAWSLVDRDPVEHWSQGRIGLLGDAAHPMLHYAAQGACQAVEDAVVLGQELAGTGEPAAGLARYADRRRARTAAVTRAARDSIGLWHASGLAAGRRARALSALAPEDFYDHLDWLHGGAGADGPQLLASTAARS